MDRTVLRIASWGVSQQNTGSRTSLYSLSLMFRLRRLTWWGMGPSPAQSSSRRFKEVRFCVPSRQNCQKATLEEWVLFNGHSIRYVISSKIHSSSTLLVHQICRLGIFEWIITKKHLLDAPLCVGMPREKSQDFADFVLLKLKKCKQLESSYNVTYSIELKI